MLVCIFLFLLINFAALAIGGLFTNSTLHHNRRYRKRPRLWFYNLQVRAFSYHLNGARCTTICATRQRAEQRR